MTKRKHLFLTVAVAMAFTLSIPIAFAEPSMGTAQHQAQAVDAKSIANQYLKEHAAAYQGVYSRYAQKRHDRWEKIERGRDALRSSSFQL